MFGIRALFLLGIYAQYTKLYETLVMVILSIFFFSTKDFFYTFICQIWKSTTVTTLTETVNEPKEAKKQTNMFRYPSGFNYLNRTLLRNFECEIFGFFNMLGASI